MPDSGKRFHPESEGKVTLIDSLVDSFLQESGGEVTLIDSLVESSFLLFALISYRFPRSTEGSMTLPLFADTTSLHLNDQQRNMIKFKIRGMFVTACMHTKKTSRNKNKN